MITELDTAPASVAIWSEALLSTPTAPKAASEDYLQACAAKYTEAERWLVSLTAELEEEERQIREKYRPRLEAAEAAKKRAFEALKKHTVKHRASFFGADDSKGPKSKKLLHGTLGFQWGKSKLAALQGIKTKLSELKQRALAAFRATPEGEPYVRVKYTLNAQAVIAAINAGTLGNDKLAEYGLQVQRGEVFFFTPDNTQTPARA